MVAGNKSSARKKKKELCGDFEFCEVCRLSHDQGRRHRYFPAHLRALSALLSRFRSRLDSLRHHRPSPLPDPGLWCPFCSLSCGDDAIGHLASKEHLKKLKHFLWKHGGATDRVDQFRVSEADLVKWEKSCRSLKSEAATSSDALIGPSPGPSKDIQFEHTTRNTDILKTNSLLTFNSSISHAVTPLQSLTHEGYRVCHPEDSGCASATFFASFATSLSAAMQENVGPQDSHVSYSIDCQPTLIGDNGSSNGCSASNGMFYCPVKLDRRTDAKEDRTQVLQNVTRKSSHSDGCQGNVHSGALPPWLEMSEENDRNLMNKGPYTNGLASLSFQKGKSKKLNPKRVGAAWAEKRRAELEMEKRGGRATNYCDDNWLPNFGRVWQEGTRKESRKEFEMEKRKFLKEDNQYDLPVKVQPYISKRMSSGSTVRRRGDLRVLDITKHRLADGFYKNPYFRLTIWIEQVLEMIVELVSL